MGEREARDGIAAGSGLGRSRCCLDRVQGSGWGRRAGLLSIFAKKKSDDLLKLLAAFSIFLASPSATGAPIGLRD